jgi:hypothetical protein
MALPARVSVARRLEMDLFPVHRKKLPALNPRTAKPCVNLGLPESLHSQPSLCKASLDLFEP